MPINMSLTTINHPQNSLNSPRSVFSLFTKTYTHNPESEESAESRIATTPKSTKLKIRVTNIHLQPRKHRYRVQKITSNACDVCHKKKVRCIKQENSTCKRCERHKIKCTFNRQLKTPGPPPKASRPNIFQENETIEYRPTLSNLIENIKLIGEEPIIRDSLLPFTVQSLILNHSKLTDFLNVNLVNGSNPPIIPMDQKIDLSNHHCYPLYLSQILIILTINLLIAEILIKFKKRKFFEFSKYPRKYMNRDFKIFKELCHLKCIEIFSILETNLIVPSVIPSKSVSSKAGENKKNSINSENKLHKLHEIFYNMSLSCLHLCNYYHTLNLTNTIIAVNMSDSNSDLTEVFGNEMQEYQKVLNLNRSITYFQLINIKKNDNNLNIKLSELFEMIFTFERYYLIFSSFNYNMHRFRNNDIITQLTYNKIRCESNNQPDRLFQLLNSLEDEEEYDEKHFSNLCKNTSFNVKLKYAKDGTLSDYWRLKRLINSFKIKNKTKTKSNTGYNDRIFEIIRNVILFKLLLIYPIGFEVLRKELYKLIANLNQQLQPSESEVFKLRISNYQLIPHLLHLLKAILHVENKFNNPGNVEIDKLKFFSPDSANQLLTFTNYLSLHFTFFNHIGLLIRTDTLLNNWFVDAQEKLEDQRNSGYHLQEELQDNTNNASETHDSLEEGHSYDTTTNISDPSIPEKRFSIDHDDDAEDANRIPEDNYLQELSPDSRSLLWT
ncbi:uncharacterized protein RJT21DRAFT_44110 [Scheffersomyces amazonensis]|uniref:uncharacterized protein n=1 Tax=Scheffersomyces amazonensis TaxID=1078765 RepID=UPI00315DB791